jgi:hypothetical protein
LSDYNNSLDIFKKVSPSACVIVSENKIKPFGGCQNWTKFWCKAIPEDKEMLFEDITEIYCK